MLSFELCEVRWVRNRIMVERERKRDGEERAHLESTVGMIPSSVCIALRVVSVDSGDMVHILSNPSNPEVVYP